MEKRPNLKENLQPVVTVATSFMRNKTQALIPENVHSLIFCQFELHLIMELENFTKLYVIMTVIFSERVSS